MRYEIPKEQMEIPQSPSEVEYRTKRDLEREIDLLLSDEGITNGLDDSAADLIITWAISQIEAVYAKPNRFSEVATAIRSHAKSVGKVAAMIADREDTERIAAHLRQLDPTIQVEELPVDLEELICVQLTSFGGEV